MDKQLARLLLLLLAVPCFAQTPNQTQQVQTYYVDAVTPGNDANPGTAASPFATVAHVASIAPNGNARVFVKFPNLSWQQLQMPYINLGALWIGQQGPSATTLYDVANGVHATMHNISWQTGNGLAGMVCDGATSYGTFTPFVKNSNFITYMLATGLSANNKQTWVETVSNGTANPIIAGVASNGLGIEYVRDASHGGSLNYPALPANLQGTGNHVYYIARNGSTAYAGSADIGSSNTLSVTGVNASSIDVGNICAVFFGSSYVSYWTGSLGAIAVYTAYPSAAAQAAQYAGLRVLQYSLTNIVRDTTFNDANLSAGPVWVRKGAVLGGGLGGVAGETQEPSVIYEGNCQVVVGANCFKMWFSVNSEQNIGYAESLDGLTWTSYGSNPVVTGHRYACVIKIGATYYMYVAVPLFTQIDLYTSANGVTWTLAHGSVITPTPGGADSQGVQNTWVLYDGLTWFMMYDGSNALTGSPSYVDLTATSTDGVTWTKNQGSATAYNYFGPAGVWFTKIDGQFWVWGQNSTSPPNTDIYRATAWRWPGLIQLYPQTSTFPRGTVSDESSQTADPMLVEVPNGAPNCSNASGCTYMYYSAVALGHGQDDGQIIKLAIAPMPIRQIILTTEGATTTSP